MTTNPEGIKALVEEAWTDVFGHDRPDAYERFQARIAALTAVAEPEESRATRAEAELAAVRANAERYVWLRDAAHDWDIYYPTDKNASGIGAWLGCTNKDAVVDAARGAG